MAVEKIPTSEKRAAKKKVKFRTCKFAPPSSMILSVSMLIIFSDVHSATRVKNAPLRIRGESTALFSSARNRRRSEDRGKACAHSKSRNELRKSKLGKKKGRTSEDRTEEATLFTGLRRARSGDAAFSPNSCERGNSVTSTSRIDAELTSARSRKLAKEKTQRLRGSSSRLYSGENEAPRLTCVRNSERWLQDGASGASTVSRRLLFFFLDFYLYMYELLHY